MSQHSPLSQTFNCWRTSTRSCPTGQLIPKCDEYAHRECYVLLISRDYLQPVSSKMKNKRSDLQAIRGIAIVAVLLFHFFPDWFPNGYVGVDQFFVLSGYLIAMILWEKDLDRGTIETFYYRRIKRIVPLYILVVLLILISMFIFFPQTNIDLNMESARYALPFTTNFQGISSSKQYTVMLHLAVDAFTHTWSLAVEMQFYLLVPLIFYASKKFGSKLILVIGCGSALYHSVTDVDTAFNSVFARLWQFCIGIGSFVIVTTMNKTPEDEADCLLEENLIDNGRSRESTSKRDLFVFFLYFCLGYCLVQEIFIAIPSVLLRLSISVLTGILIILGTQQTIFPMNSRILVYVGDISYALYLVHWPLYSYVKMEYPDDFKVLCIALFGSICLAVFFTETYEKCYLKLEKCSVLSLIGILYVLCIVVLIFHWLHTQNLDDFKVDLSMYRNITKEDAIQLNEKWDANDQKQIRPPACFSKDGVCEFKRSNNSTSDGPSVLLLGNSYAGNVAEIINESCNKTASRISMYWVVACELLIYTASYKTCSPKLKDAYLDIVIREQPDILFMLVRHLELMKPLASNVSILDDPLYKEAIVRLNNYEQFVSKTIYVLDAIPRSTIKTVDILDKELKIGKMLNMSALIDNIPDRSEYAKLRLAELVKNCRKCQMIDYSPYLTVNGEFQFYDTSNGLSYFTAGLHLTPYGLRKIQPLFQNVCRSF